MCTFAKGQLCNLLYMHNKTAALHEGWTGFYKTAEFPVF